MAPYHLCMGDSALHLKVGEHAGLCVLGQPDVEVVLCPPWAQLVGACIIVAASVRADLGVARLVHDRTCQGAKP